MKKFLYAILILVFTLVFGKEAKATHLMGSDISWQCLGNDTFEIKLVVYRRCTDGASTLQVPIPTIASDSCGNSYIVSAGTYRSYTVEDITPLCITQQKLCPSAGGTGQSTPQIPYGVEKHTLVYKIYLGGTYKNCCWYKIQYQLCCRNSNITTGYADQDFVTEAWLNRCLSTCDNSPTFKNSPIMIKCAGQNVFYNHGVNDIDGDSLSFAPALPLGGGSYTSPWSYTYPLTCLGGNNPNPLANPPTGFNINPATGDLSFTPMQVQITVLKIMVTEWRKDSNGIFKVIGKTTRDMQFAIVQNCNNKLPQLTGPYFYNVCVGEKICIDIHSSDPDLTDTTQISWNHDIPNGTWLDSNGMVKNSSGTFCWTPNFTDVRTLPYVFTVNTNDDHCPMIGITARSYVVRVNPTPIKPTITHNITQLFSSPGYSYQWYMDTTLIIGANNISFQPTNTSSYKVRVTNIYGCSVFSDLYSYTAGIKNNSLNSEIKISPNPFHDILKLEFTEFEKEINISLYDVQGKLVLDESSPATNNFELDCKRLSSGLYFLVVNDGKNRAMFKVEKQ
jgi:hypothetical protein